MSTSIFWNKKWGKNNNICGITLSRLRPGKNKNNVPYVITLSCSHRFYRKALYHWYNHNKTCPICRKPIKFKDLFV